MVGESGRNVLLPLLVAAAVGTISAWLIVGPPIGALAGPLGIAMGLAGLAGGGSAWWLERRRARRRDDPLEDALGELSRLAEGDSKPAVPEPRQPSARLSVLTQQLGAKLDHLEEDGEHLRTVLNSLSEGVLVVDAEGRTAIVNQSWRRLFGVTGEVEGRSVLEVTRQTALDRLIATTLDQGAGQQAELEVTHGRRRTVVLTSSPLTDGAGVVVWANDLTPFLHAGEVRRDFVANVSHELKTPLSAIRGFAETLSDGALDDRVASERFLDRILKQCSRLEALLSDLLTLSRLEHPTASTGWVDVDMRAVVSEAIDLTSEALVDRGLRLDVDLQPVPHFPGDTEAIVRLSLNLLENAIKYNQPEGRVAVRLAAEGDLIVLEVADTGIGISADAIARLFERFYRVDKGRSRDEGGTGLGLAIVKHAAQLHGGRVEVESDLGRGSTFRVELPIVRTP